MAEINERLKMYFVKKNIEQTEVAKNLNVSKQRINNWFTDTSIPMYVFTDILTKWPDLNPIWLFTGKGYMSDIEINLTQEPTSPYLTECKNPLCAEKIHGLQEQIKLLREMNDLLKTELRRKVDPPENKPEGGVEEAIRRTG